MSLVTRAAADALLKPLLKCSTAPANPSPNARAPSLKPRPSIACSITTNSPTSSFSTPIAKASIAAPCKASAASQLKGNHSLKLPRSQGQKARSVTRSVRFIEVEIAVPKHASKYLKMSTPIKANIIELREEGVEKGICWRLLTTLPVPDIATAIRLACWYAKRWQIEEFHRTLKTGCRVEARQMRSLERLKPMMALDMIVASGLMGMRAAAREQPESPASDWLDEEEISALEAYHRKSPRSESAATPLSIGQAVQWIARLGGHLGRKGDGHPRSPSPLARPPQARGHHASLEDVWTSLYLWVKLRGRWRSLKPACWRKGLGTIPRMALRHRDSGSTWQRSGDAHASRLATTGGSRLPQSGGFATGLPSWG